MTAKPRLLLTGISGLLGSNLAYFLRHKYQIHGVFNGHGISCQDVQSHQVDITDEQQVIRLVQRVCPDVVIHAAALANVDQCEENPVLANRINVEGTKYLAQCLNRSISLAFISTDLVYEGGRGNFSENDHTVANNRYAQTKIDAEKIVLARDKSLIFRTNFFGWNVNQRPAMAQWVIEELKQGRSINGFIDARVSSIYSKTMADLIDKAIERQLTGIYNLGASSSMTKYEFLRLVAVRMGLPQEQIKPLSLDSVPLKAKRCKDLSLVMTKLSQDLSINIPTMEQCVEDFVEDYQRGIFKDLGQAITSRGINV